MAVTVGLFSMAVTVVLLLPPLPPPLEQPKMAEKTTRANHAQFRFSISATSFVENPESGDLLLKIAGLALAD
jgi:hypothetical protein